MNAKFFDHRRYDLTKAGRYKLKKKLGVINRIEGNILKEDIISAEGKVVYKKGKKINKAERNILREEFNKGINMVAYPMTHEFSHPDIISIPTKWKKSLVGRVLATNIDGNDITLDAGTVLSKLDVEMIAKEFDTIKARSMV